MIKLALILLVPIFSDSTSNLEQKVCDYFFETILKAEYQDYKAIEFKSETDTSKYPGIVHQCKNLDQETKNQITSAMPAGPVTIESNVKGISVKKYRKNSGRLKIYFNSRIRVGDNYFVLITAYRKLNFADYYFIMFDKDGNIVETCKAGEII